MLNYTPEERMLDSRGRLYFLWDLNIELKQFKSMLRDPDEDIRAYMLGKLMRQAKPDDVFQFVELKEISNNWKKIEKHLGKTRDFWRWLLERWEQNMVLGEVEEILFKEGLSVELLQRSKGFIRVNIRSEDDSVTLDMVSDLTELVEPDQETYIDTDVIKIANKREIFINKICSLLSRAEIRDLIDVKALMESGLNLEETLADAPKQDGGFSTLTLSWILKELRIDKIGKVSGLCDRDIRELDEFREELIDRILKTSKPE